MATFGIQKMVDIVFVPMHMSTETLIGQAQILQIEIFQTQILGQMLSIPIDLVKLQPHLY